MFHFAGSSTMRMKTLCPRSKGQGVCLLIIVSTLTMSGVTVGQRNRTADAMSIITVRVVSPPDQEGDNADLLSSAMRDMDSGEPHDQEDNMMNTEEDRVPGAASISPDENALSSYITGRPDFKIIEIYRDRSERIYGILGSNGNLYFRDVSPKDVHLPAEEYPMNSLMIVSVVD